MRVKFPIYKTQMILIHFVHNEMGQFGPRTIFDKTFFFERHKALVLESGNGSIYVYTKTVLHREAIEAPAKTVLTDSTYAGLLLKGKKHKVILPHEAFRFAKQNKHGLKLVSL